MLLRRSADDTTRGRIVAAWQTVLAINDEVSVEEFLRHYWVSHRGDVKARKLYREIRDTIVAENLDPLTMSLDLAEAAPVYRDIVRAREADIELARLLEGIRSLGAKVLYPVLLSGYAVDESSTGVAKRRELASALTALFVRYNVIAGRETTVMETTVYAVAAKLRTTRDFDAAIRELADLAPTGQDFVNGFGRASVSRIATARYLLREIEHAKRRTGEVAVEGTDRVHVEHIYPRTPSGTRWTNHAQVIHRLGNLTLLGRRLNVAIQNSDFRTKKEKGYVTSDILLTKELLEFDEWDAAAIDRRQRELSDWVFGIWKFPGESPPPRAGGDGSASIGVTDATPLDQLPEVPD